MTAGMIFLYVMCLAQMFCGGFTEREKPYIDFNLVEISARSSQKLDRILRNLNHIDELSRNHDDNSAVAIVTPDNMDHVREVVSRERAVVNILEKNLQNLVDEEYHHLDMRRGKRQAMNLDQAIEEFLDLEGIYDFQERVVSSCNSDAMVKKRTIGFSFENRPINVIQISKDNKMKTRQTIFIEAGVHAREWLSPAAANYIIYQLACNKKDHDLLDIFNWEIISVTNPDGYHYTHASGHRYWRKNRQINEGSECIGTDLNRNFETGFGEARMTANLILWNRHQIFLKGANKNPCSDQYMGAYNYSAPESKALRDYVLGMRDRIISYLSLHTYGQYILFPWGYTDAIPPDYENLMALAKVAENAMGLPFKIGSAHETIYPASGVSQDFARDVAGIKRSFTWELMPEKEHLEGIEGFSPDVSLVPVYTPIIWRGLKAFVQAVANETGAVMENPPMTVKDGLDPNEDLSGQIELKTKTLVSEMPNDNSLKSFHSLKELPERWYSVMREVLNSKGVFSE